MNLLATARALDDQELRWRVAAACVHHASGFASMPPGHAQNYAFWTLLHPQDVDPSMVAFVTAWAPVADKITVSNGSVSTSGVLDEDIMDAVQQSWDLVAAKYPQNPLEV